ncbi:hypothetical protein Avbf_02506 [Armadillidium vulgare]|nr:hypothetical protein Avbf_02506 [Armadillidium vulgare]
MKKDIIFKGKYDIEIFTTTNDSCISKTKEDDYEFFSIENVEECVELVSYKGVITSIVNKEAGIFKLDGKVLLVASFLMEVSSELVNEKAANQEREFSPVYKFWKSNCGILHCLHVFNFGLSFLYWLCDLEAFFLNVLFKNGIPQEKIKSCQWKEKKGLVWKYVEEQLKDCEKRCRSLLLEFLLSDHSCILKQEFVGFQLIAIDELLNYEEVGASQESVKDMNSHWRYSYFGKEIYKWVLFGVLCVSRTGALRVELNGYYINLVVVGSKGDLYTKLNHTVAVYNFDYIHEEFDMDDEPLNQKYIILRSADVISISENNSEAPAKNIIKKLGIL